MTRDLFYRVTIGAAGAECDLSDQLTSLVLEQREMQPDQLSIDVADPYKVLGHAVQEGMDVELELGTDDDHSVLFRGAIYKVDGAFPQDGTPTLKLLAFDATMHMGLRRRSRAFTDRALSTIVGDIGRDYAKHIDALDVHVLGDVIFGENGVRQEDETDLEFLLRLATTYGCVMYVESDDAGDTLHFIDEYSVMRSDPEVTLYHGRCDVPARLLSFTCNADVGQIQLPRALCGMDLDTGAATEVITADADVVASTEDAFRDENFAVFRRSSPVMAAELEALLLSADVVKRELRAELGVIERVPVATFTTEDDLRARARNAFSTSLMGMRASGSTVGNKALFARTNVEIADVGGRFSGTWYLSQVRHLLDRRGHTTDFECRR